IGESTVPLTTFGGGAQLLTGGYAVGYRFGAVSPTSPGSGVRFLAVGSAASDEGALAVLRLVGADVATESVRGHDAVVSSNAFAPQREQTLSVSWLERPGELVQLTGSRVSRADLLRVAGGLRPAEDGEWQDLARRTRLGELNRLAGSVEVGRGEFGGGVEWVLTAEPSVPAGGGYSPALGLDLAPDGSTSVSSSSTGSGSTDGSGVGLRSTGTTERGGRHFAYGLVGPRVDTVRVVQGGTTIAEAKVIGGAQRGWALEIPARPCPGRCPRPPMAQVIALAADGSELGRDQLAGGSNTSGGGSGSAPQPRLPGAGVSPTSR
ncbi:MAG: hypothetical protein JWM05_959, partial [Acidimicrobiales bacterium]|nr:hypothetical protein [Acidimicrobiales bacterium]